MAFQFNQGDRPLTGYTIQRGVGRGGFGEVYYATSDGGKEVALKYLRENPQIEIRGTAHCLNLKSPYLVALLDIKQNAEGDFFVIMEYVDGPSLRDLLTSAATDPAGLHRPGSPQQPPAAAGGFAPQPPAATGGLGLQKAAYFLREIGKGLAYLHDRGIVHRDLKPGNIFYEDGYVKIGDYGLAKIMAASQHSGQTVSVGTVYYMAPEVGSGNYDRTIDIYALGVVLYEMLLGRVPFSGATMGEVLMKHLTAQPAVDELPEPFPGVIRKALAKDPKDRYQTVGEMMADLFAVEDLSRSVASLDSLSLTRMAAAVSKKVRQGAAVGVKVGMGTGSSNVPGLGGTPAAPPPIVERAHPGSADTMDAGRGLPPPIPVAGPATRDDQGRRLRGFVKDGWFPQKSRLTTGLLGLFLGPLGAHRIYTGDTGTGVLQIVLTVCTGGIAGLWGFIEGIRILAGFDYRDALGRPLLDRRSKSRGRSGSGREDDKTPLDDVVEDLREGIGRFARGRGAETRNGPRGTVARTLWGISAFTFLATAAGLGLGGTLAPPEWDVATPGIGNPYAVNMFHLMYVFATVALAIGAFSMWKASHRAGLPAWRRTIRPGLMCGLVAVMGVALTVGSFFLDGSMQMLGVIVFGVAAVAFTFLWLLRGPEIPRQPQEAYWDRASAVTFAVIGLLALFGAGRSLRGWGAEGGAFELPNVTPGTVVLKHRRYDSELQAWQYGTAEFSIVQRHFNHAPIVGGACLLLAIGSFGESRYRWRRAVHRKDRGPESQVA